MGKFEKERDNDPKPGKPKKKRTVLQVLLIILLVILVLIGIVAGFLWSKLDLIEFDDEIDKSVYQNNETIDFSNDDEEQIVDISGLEIVETAPVISDGEAASADHVMNILLIGTDERTKEFNENARSDSMIIVSIDKKNNTVKLVSLERGMAAPVLEGVYEGKYDWLTHIFRYGGSDLLTRTVEYMFKIDIDHYVRLNFNSVTQVVDTIGGITVELTKNEASHVNKSLNMEKASDRLVEGENRLNGQQALAFARLRAIDSDWQRVKRQRKVILAVVDELQGTTLTQLNQLADDVLPLIQTDMSKLDIAQLVLYAPNFLTSTFDQMTIPQEGTYGGMAIMGNKYGFAPDYEINNALLYEFLYGAEE